MPSPTPVLAFGVGKAGRPQEGLEVVEEGLASVAMTGEQLATPLLKLWLSATDCISEIGRKPVNSGSQVAHVPLRL